MSDERRRPLSRPRSWRNHRTCRKRSMRGSALPPKPTIHNIRPEDFECTWRLMALQAHAASVGEWTRGEDPIEWLAIAEHARSVGKDRCRLFRWLLGNRKHAFVTQAEEDRAVLRWSAHRALRHQPQARTERGRALEDLVQNLAATLQAEPAAQGAVRAGRSETDNARGLSEDSRFVEVCVQVARQHRLREERWWHVARARRGWSEQRWEQAYRGYQFEQTQAWCAADAVASPSHARRRQGLAPITRTGQSGGGVTSGTGTAEHLSRSRPPAPPTEGTRRW